MKKVWIALIVIFGLWYGFKRGFLAVAIGTPEDLREAVDRMK